MLEIYSKLTHQSYANHQQPTHKSKIQKLCKSLKFISVIDFFFCHEFSLNIKSLFCIINDSLLKHLWCISIERRKMYSNELVNSERVAFKNSFHFVRFEIRKKKRFFPRRSSLCIVFITAANFYCTLVCESRWEKDRSREFPEKRIFRLLYNSVDKNRR